MGERIVVAVTGASGAPYARLLLHELVKHREIEVALVVSRAGELVYRAETGTDIWRDVTGGVSGYREDDWTAPFASGSASFSAMVIVPCTMATLGAVAWGSGRNLIHRVADVCLKERRKLILVPRETPLHRGHLENMLRCVDLGALILPAMPGFYHHPSSAEDLVRFVVARILDHLGVAHDLMEPWGGVSPDEA